MNIDQANRVRFKPGAPHYESFFVRANHPSRPLAFWIRYTIIHPRDEGAKSLGELWAIYFNGETGEHTAMKKEFPLQECLFSNNPFMIKIGSATLEMGKLRGSAGAMHWDLNFSGSDSPLLLLPENLYGATFPAAKSLVPLPLAAFKGILTVNNETVSIENWVGSQNHNWGRKHTDRYAWGQVSGFDNARQTFLEVATAQLKMGAFMTPPFTLMVLRHEGNEIQLNSLALSIRAKGRFDYFNWAFASKKQGWKIEGNIDAHQPDFVGLRYGNPPGGIKHCLNTKIASCEVRLTHPSGKVEMLTTKNRAAFEIMTDEHDHNHGVEIRV
jgi:hypothetical protein